MNVKYRLSELRVWLGVFLAGLLGLLGLVHPVEAISFLNETDVSSVLETSEGHARLRWGKQPSADWQENEKVVQVDLVLNLDNGSHEIFHSVGLSEEVPTAEFFVSGLAQGDSIFLLVGPRGKILDRLIVRTEYPSLRFVFGLVAVGATLFVFLVIVIWRGEIEGRNSSS